MLPSDPQEWLALPPFALDAETTQALAGCGVASSANARVFAFTPSSPSVHFALIEFTGTRGLYYAPRVAVYGSAACDGASLLACEGSGLDSPYVVNLSAQPDETLYIVIRSEGEPPWRSELQFIEYN
jgi:hypothetical protein